MTALLNVEFDDEHGETRRLRRDEVLNSTMLLAGAGNETTAKLIGWTGKLLADHPDQRREIAEDPALVTDAIEEILRFEPPGFQFARSVIADVEFSGGTVPAGNVVVCSLGAANRDPGAFPTATGSIYIADRQEYSPSLSGSTSAWGPRSRDSRDASRCKRWSSAFRRGRSMRSGRYSYQRRRLAATTPCQFTFEEPTVKTQTERVCGRA